MTEVHFTHSLRLFFIANCFVIERPSRGERLEITRPRLIRLLQVVLAFLHELITVSLRSAHVIALGRTHHLVRRCSLVDLNFLTGRRVDGVGADGRAVFTRAKMILCQSQSILSHVCIRLDLLLHQSHVFHRI